MKLSHVHESLLRYPGSGCQTHEGEWQHFAWKAGGKPEHVGLCKDFDHDGAEPWLPWDCCCGKPDCKGR